MKHRRLATVLTLATVWFTNSQAHAGWSVSAVGGFALANQSFSDRTANNQAQVKATVNTDNQLAYGLYVHHRFEHEWYGLSVGFLSTEMGSKIKSFQSPNTRTYNEKLPYYTFPVTFDYYVHDQVSLGAGFYYAMASGSVVSSGDLNGVSQFYTSGSFESAGYKSTDYGLVIAARATQPFSPKWEGVANFTFLQGISNISTIGGGTISNSALLIMVGLGYRF